MILEAINIKPLQLVGQVAEFKFQSKFEPMLFQKVIEGLEGCLVAVGLKFEPYRWRPCGVTWDSSRKVRGSKAAANLRARGQNQRPSSWGSSPALLVVGRAQKHGVSESVAVAAGRDRPA